MNITFVGCSIKQHGTFFRWHRLARELIALGHSVEVLASDCEVSPWCKTKEIDGVPYVLTARAKGDSLFGGGHFNLLSAAKRMWPVRTQKPDIVHLFEPLPTIAATLLCNSKLRRAKTVWDWCDLWNGGLLNPRSHNKRIRWNAHTAGRLERWFCRKVDAVTAISDFLLNKASEFGAKKTYYLPNGLEQRKISREDARSHFKLQNDIKYLVFAGRTTAELSWCFKSLEVALKGYAGKTHLLLAGMGQAQCMQLGGELCPHWTYVGDLPASDVQILYSASDLGLLPLEHSLFNESRLPLKLLDMLGSGCPVLASEVGDVGRIARQLSGIYLSPDDSVGFANSVVEALRQCGVLRNDICENAMLFECWTWHQRARELTEYYEEMVCMRC